MEVLEVKKRGVCFGIFAVVLSVILIISIIAVLNTDKEFKGAHIEYNCDVKNFKIATTINIDKDGKEFVKVKGNVWTFVTDPLTMYDMDDKKIAHAGDAYHFVAQDSHTIYVDNNFACEMVGLVDLLGESYEIYNQEQNKIAKITFNATNTSGQMYDMEDNLIADYSSNFFFNDFTVRISEKCELDEKAVLLIFCSYYSDQSYDASNE